MRALLMKVVRWVTVLSSVVTVVTLGSFRLDGADAVIPLPEVDREKLEAGLGRGVVGNAVAAPTIVDPAKFIGVVASRTWVFRLTAGRKKGQIEEYTLTLRKRESGAVWWKADTGPDTARYLRPSENGSVELVSDEDRSEGVVTRYSPPEPLWVSHLKPGDVRRSRHEVKVYDLGDPTDVSHHGYVDLVCTYVGAYEVTVPAGTFHAALLKWEYEGRIGAAPIQDVEYELLAPNVGPVALIEKIDTSSFLFEKDPPKVGRILVSYSKE